MKTTITTNESFISELKKEILSLNKWIAYCREEISKTNEKWIIKEYEGVIRNHIQERDEKINRIALIKTL